jgi:hypothetical protein
MRLKSREQLIAQGVNHLNYELLTELNQFVNLQRFMGSNERARLLMNSFSWDSVEGYWEELYEKWRGRLDFEEIDQEVIDWLDNWIEHFQRVFYEDDTKFKEVDDEDCE